MIPISDVTPEHREDIYLEIARSKVFACALQWPGWCRSGKDEESAIRTLLDYAPRYFRILQPTGLALTIPTGKDELTIVDRVAGSPATSFGVPDAVRLKDALPMTGEEIKRSEIILEALWAEFDRCIRSARGKQLRKGPRGGGRELQEIIEHVARAELGYLRHIGCYITTIDPEEAAGAMDRIRREVINGIEAAALGNLPARGPRGGKLWPLRYFIRRLAWHVIDHAWEIEDRIMD